MMRRLFVGGAVILLLAAGLPAFGGETAATNYRNQHNMATARFGDDSTERGVFLAMGETIGGMDHPIYGYLAFWDGNVYCTGMNVAGGPQSTVYDYYFKNNGAYLNADIEVACEYGATPIVVHVEATWNGSGGQLIETDQHKMEFGDYKFIGVQKVVIPDITSVDFVMDFDLSGSIPALFDQSVRLVTSHGVTPHP